MSTVQTRLLAAMYLTRDQDLAQEAADRIDALEAVLRKVAAEPGLPLRQLRTEISDVLALSDPEARDE